MSEDKKKSEVKSEAKADVAPKAEPTLNETIREAISAGMVAVTQLQRSGLDPNTPLVPARKPQVNYSVECQECFQPAMACHGKHVKMTVWAPRYQKGFRGVAINGHWYLSTYPGQLVTVPAEAEDNIKVHINKYVEAEEEMRKSRSWDPRDANQGLTPHSVRQ